MSTQNNSLEQSVESSAIETRNCLRCKGAGEVEYILDKSKMEKCYACNGAGVFNCPDFGELFKMLFTSRGGKTRFRAAFPSKIDRYKNTVGGRAYYIWRLARFHGGVDVTLPMFADLIVRGDPYKKELDAASELIAKKVFGTDLAAAYRWGSALGIIQSDKIPSGLPQSAYENGAVVLDGNKIPEEELELK